MTQEPDIVGRGAAEQAVRELARMHKVSVSRSGVDDWADQITRLADDNVALDEIEELIVALRWAGVADGVELTRLHSRYLDERDAPDDRSCR